MNRRVVFDTGVVVSALVLESRNVAWLRAHWLNRECVPLLSRETAAELVRVLAYLKFQMTEDEQQEVLADYLPICEVVKPGRACPVKCRDLNDQPFLDLAHCGRADVLVTGDRDLLTVAGKTAFTIESPEAYRVRVGSE